VLLIIWIEYFSLWEIRNVLALVCKKWNRIAHDPRFNTSITISKLNANTNIDEWITLLTSEGYRYIFMIKFNSKI